MKEIKLHIDGTEITAQIDESELAKLAKPERARTGYERANVRETYYSAKCSDYGIRDINATVDRENYNNGDYVNDKKLHDDRDRARVLHDRLEQWQALNDEPVDWGNSATTKHNICFDYSDNTLNIDTCDTYRNIGVIYFSTDDKAQEAINVFHDELMWYYTKYRSRLDEIRTGAAE